MTTTAVDTANPLADPLLHVNNLSLPAHGVSGPLDERRDLAAIRRRLQAIPKGVNHLPNVQADHMLDNVSASPDPGFLL